MVTEKTAIIRHLDGSTTALHVAGKSAVFGLDVTDCWVVTPPDGFTPRSGDELVTDLPDGRYEYAVPIAHVLTALRTGPS